MYFCNCEACKPDCFGNCPCDYGFACSGAPILQAEPQEKPEKPEK